MNDLVAEGYDLANQRDFVAIRREISQKLGECLPYDSEFAFDGRAQQLIL